MKFQSIASFFNSQFVGSYVTEKNFFAFVFKTTGNPPLSMLYVGCITDNDEEVFLQRLKGRHIIRPPFDERQRIQNIREINFSQMYIDKLSINIEANVLMSMDDPAWRDSIKFRITLDEFFSEAMDASEVF